MEGRLLFVVTEFDPVVPGGAGTLVAGLVGRLAAAGSAVTVVLVADVDQPVARAAQSYDVVVAPPGAPGEDGPFLARSRAAAAAVAELSAAAAPRLVEFQDFDGLGFWALSHRAALGLEAVPIGLRVHGPTDLITETMPVVPPELEQVRVMEREAFAMADLVVAPSRALADLISARYGVEAGRLRVGPPPVPDRSRADRRPGPDPEFVAFGRLAEVKGSEDFLRAAVRVAEEVPSARFRFVGRDGWNAAAGRMMGEWLAEQVPTGLRDRISFDGPVPPDEIGAALATAWAVVMPSRFESFNLAAHEVRRLGPPLVLPDLPAFRDFFSPATGAEIYDGTPAALAEVLARLAGSPQRVAELTAAPAPTLGDPLRPYSADPPAPRHPRSQAGLATAAVNRVAAAAPGPARDGRAARLAQAALRVLPEWAARLAVRVVPQRLKDRLRPVASWPAEEERRRAERRHAGFRAQVAAGAYPEHAEPEVTVVIPCYNQGPFLEDALVSVFAQTFDSFEVVVVDDGSTDPETIAVLDALDLPRTRLLRQQNRGLPAARNAGMALARGRFVVPLDADDELAPDFLARLRTALDEHPAAGYAHCWSELFGDQHATWVARPFNPYLLALSNSVVGCVLLRKEAWEQVGGYDETMVRGNEDWDMWLRLLEAGWDQVLVRAPLFRYRRHGVSMSVTTEARFDRARAEIAERHPQLFRPDALRRLKAEWYPWVTVLSDGSDQATLAAQDFDDVEVVPVGADAGTLPALCAAQGWPCRDPAPDLAAAVRMARGKFVADWSQIDDAGPDALRTLAAALEDVPKATAAGPGGEALLWRRWALVDPGSGHEGVVAIVVSAAPAGPSRLAAGCCVVPDWTTDDAPAGLPVLRHDPEERGEYPAWVEESA